MRSSGEPSEPILVRGSRACMLLLLRRLLLGAGAVTDDVRTVIVRHSVHRRHGRRRMKSHGELLLLRAQAACNAMRHRLEYASMPLEGISTSTGTTYVGPAVLTRHAVGHLSKGAIADFISGSGGCHQINKFHTTFFHAWVLLSLIENPSHTRQSNSLLRSPKLLYFI